MTISAYLYSHFLRPRSQEPDRRRQEFIFNIILMALIVAALLATTVVTIDSFSTSIVHYSGSLITTWVFAIVVAGLFGLSRIGKARIAIIVFVTLLSLIMVQLAVQWGFMLPTALLLAAMIVVIAGVLLSARSGLWFAVGAGAFLLVLSYLQQQNIIDNDDRWLTDDFHVGDAVGYVIIVGIIGVVSWLSNREIDRSLRRARASEKALSAERDSLEIKVKARTQELESAQMARLTELQRFATFGRLSANLLHEIASPLTAVSLNLESMDLHQSALMKQAQTNLKYLERYVQAARKQLQGEASLTTFSINNEVKQLLRMLEPRAKHSQVAIEYTPSAPLRTYGDSVKFSQLIANLLANAIDASVANERPKKVIRLAIKADKQAVQITVHNFGHYVSAEQQRKIFEPFFTTKQSNGKSLGIGLAMVRQFTEQDFGGTITVVSSRIDGTTFTVTLPQRHDEK